MKVKTSRSLLMYSVLSLITCGVYGVLEMRALIRDVNKICAGDGRQTCGLVKLILLTVVTCGIYLLYWCYCMGNRLWENARRYGKNAAEDGTTLLMWMVFGTMLCAIGPYVALHIIFKNTNIVASGYNGELFGE